MHVKASCALVSIIKHTHNTHTHTCTPTPTHTHTAHSLTHSHTHTHTHHSLTHSLTHSHNHFLSAAQAIPHHSRHRPNSFTDPLCDEQAEDARGGDLPSPQQAPVLDPRVPQQQGKETHFMYSQSVSHFTYMADTCFHSPSTSTCTCKYVRNETYCGRHIVAVWDRSQILFHQVFSPSLSFTDKSDVHVFNSVQVVYEPRPQ